MAIRVRFFIKLFCFSTFSLLHAFVIDQHCSFAPMAKNIPSHQSVSTGDYFSLATAPYGEIKTSPRLLRDTALDTLRYIERYQKTHKNVLAPKDFTRDLMSLQKVKQSLKFIVNVINWDTKHDHKQRILDPDFLKNNFGFIKWHADSRDGEVRLTKYTVYNFAGSDKKQGVYRYPLYALSNSASVPGYTKQQVLKGALRQHIAKGVVKPLTWLSREGLEEALMQGTIFVQVPGKKLQAFNVHRHNGIDYDVSISPLNQKRYWYFRNVNTKGIKRLYHSYQHRKDVVFAGNIHAIGIGKIIAISYKDKQTGVNALRLGILADTGSAFKNNFSQLDFFVGVSPNKRFLQQKIASYPSHVQAYILYKKGKGVTTRNS